MRAGPGGCVGRVNGAALLARALRGAGVGPVFTLSGHQILPIYDAGLDASLRFVDTRHEAAAVHMADGWGRLTGQPGVALVTAAPGHANTMTALATAQLSESPLLLISGGSETTRAGMGGFQEMDQCTMARPVTKAALSPRTVAEIPALVAKALRVSLEGVPGPTHLTVPYDLLHAAVDEAELDWSVGSAMDSAEQSANEGQAKQFLELLAKARKPVLLARPSVLRGAAGQHLQRLLELTGLPHLPIDSAVGLNEPSLHGLPRLLPQCDLVILLTPQDFAIDFAEPPTISPDCTVVQVTPTQAELAQNRHVDLGIVGSYRAVLRQLVEEAGRRSWPASAWRAEIEAMRAEQLASTRPHETSQKSPLHPMRVAAAVRSLLGPRDCVALDGGDFVRWARWAFGGGPWELLTNGKLGALGPGIPLASVVSLARPGARGVAFVGDGGFGFHAMELDTAVRHNLPLVVVIGNDAGWSTERHRQREVYGPDRLVAANLLPTRYDLLAQALGAHGEYVERPEDLAPALRRAFSSGKPTCVNVMIAADRPPSTAP